MLRIILIIALLMSFNSSLFSQSIDSGEVESWKLKGMHFKKEGQTDSALTYFEKILDSNPNDYDAILNVAQLYLDAGEFKKSIAQYKKIIEKNESEPFAHFGLGMNYLATEEYSLAKYHFRRTTQLLPEFIPGYSRLASVYVYTDENDLAIATYKRYYFWIIRMLMLMPGWVSYIGGRVNPLLLKIIMRKLSITIKMISR